MWLGENVILGMADKGLDAVVEARDAVALFALSIKLESSTTDGNRLPVRSGFSAEKALKILFCS